MGCTASKLDNEDTVRRCKERRRLMKEAVQSRHHLASAHNDYLRSLLTTGSALTRFARGEPISVSQQTPPILLHSSNPSSFPIPSSSLPPPTPQPPPPPPPPPFSPSPSPTIASSKLPHILSDSSTASKKSASPKYPRAVHAQHAAYASTPSQASSVWDWENFYPPSPPDSEFFDRIKEEREKEERFHFQNRHQHQHQHHLREEDEEEEEEEEEEGERREEVHCSEWGEGQHCGSSTTSSMTKSDDEDEEKYSRSDEFAARSEFGGSEPASRPAPSEIGSSSMRHSVRKDRSETGSSSGWTARDDASVAGELRMVVRHRDLAEIVEALEEYFLKAAGAGEQMSEILETGRDQLDRSFRQLKSEFF